MEDIFKQDENREIIKKAFLEHLQKFKKDNWTIFGWDHMNLKKRKWLIRPQKLSECHFYRIIEKCWLGRKRIVTPRKSNRDGLVKYIGLKDSDSKAFVESVYFQLLLAKGAEVCTVNYGEHEFSNEVFEKTLGGARFSIAFKNWLEIIPAILNKG